MSILVSPDQSTFLHMFVVSPTWLVANCMALFQQWLSSCNSSIKARFECMTNSWSVHRFSHLSCGSLQLLQGYHGPLGCFSDQCSPCLACQFRWTAMSWKVCSCAIFFPFPGDGLDWIFEIFKAWDIFSYPNHALNFSTTLSLACLVCSLGFMMLFVH